MIQRGGAEVKDNNNVKRRNQRDEGGEKEVIK